MARKPFKAKPGRLWQDAAAFAAAAHEHAYRDDDRTPYFSHCARVAMTVAGLFGCTDEIALAAAFLHDVIEDTGTDYDEVAERFGAEVAACVAALTKNRAMPEAAREHDYDRRLAQADWRARLVKLADVYDNFMDAKTAARRRSMRGKSRRAITLAAGDARKRGETARAVALVSHAIR